MYCSLKETTFAARKVASFIRISAQITRPSKSLTLVQDLQYSTCMNCFPHKCFNLFHISPFCKPCISRREIWSNNSVICYWKTKMNIILEILRLQSTLCQGTLQRASNRCNQACQALQNTSVGLLQI